MIKIANLYYMLCYAQNTLELRNKIDVDTKELKDVLQLFVKIMTEGTTTLFKRGLDRGFVLHSEQLSRLRGRIDFAHNLKTNFLKTPRLHCEFDEMSYDVLHNQIIKATLKSKIRQLRL